MKIHLILDQIIGTFFYSEPNDMQLKEVAIQGYEVFMKNKELIILKDKEEKYYAVLFQNATQQNQNSLIGISELTYPHHIFKMKKIEKYLIRDTYDISGLFNYMKDREIRHEFDENHLFRTENSILYFDINNQDSSYSIQNCSYVPLFNAQVNIPYNQNSNYYGAAPATQHSPIVVQKNGIKIIDEYLKNKFKYDEGR